MFRLSVLGLLLFSAITYADQSKNIYYIEKNNLIGFIDDNGKIVIRPEYDVDGYHFIGTGRNDFIIVNKNNKQGVIDYNGNIIIDIKFDKDTNSFNFNGGKIAAYRLNGECGYITDQGKIIIKNIYDDCNLFSNGKAAVKLESKWGVIDENGNVIVDFKYDEIDSFYEGLAAFKVNSKYGYLDENGNVKIQPNFEELSLSFSSGLARIGSLIHKKKYYFIDKNGNKVIDVKFDHVYPFDGDFAVIIDNYLGKEKYGVIDKKGNTYLAPQYQYIGYNFYYDEDKILTNVGVYKFGSVKNGIMDLKTKQFIVPPIYEDIGVPYKEVIWFKKNGKYGWMNDKFKIIIQPKYDEILTGFGKGNLALVILNGKTGYINYNGQWISDFIIDE